MSEKVGYVKLHRKSLDSSVFQNANTWYVWSWCLMKANHETHKFPWNGGDMEVVAGQFITGIEKATKELHGISKQSFRTILKYLKTSGRVDLKSTNKFTLVTVLNWPKYQNDNKQLTNKQQTTNKQLTTYKNDKKEKNDKNIVDSPNGSSTLTSKPMNYEELNDGDVTYDSEDSPKKKDTFGRFPSRISIEYCKLTGNNKASAQLKAAKELMRLALKEYPNDTQEQHFTEIVSRMKIAKVHYENLPQPIHEWSLGKIVEKWDKILTEWYQENLKLKK